MECAEKKPMWQMTYCWPYFNVIKKWSALCKSFVCIDQKDIYIGFGLGAGFLNMEFCRNGDASEAEDNIGHFVFVEKSISVKAIGFLI